MRYLLFFSLCVGMRFVHAQSGDKNFSTDTTAINLLLNKSDLLTDSLPQDAMLLLKKADLASQRARYEKGMVRTWNLQGHVYKLQGRFDSAIYYYKRAIGLALRKSWEDEFCVGSLGAGGAYMRLHQGDSSRRYLGQAITTAVKLKDNNLEAGAYNDLGNVFLNENKTEEALTNFIKAANLYEQASNTDGLAGVWTNIGNVEFKMGNYDKAIDYTRRSMRVARKGNNLLNLAYCHKLLAVNYRKQKKFTEALHHYDSSFSIYFRIGAKREAAEISNNTGNIYFDLEKYDQAIAYYEKSMRICREIDFEYLLCYGYSGMAYTYYQTKRYPLALAYCDSLMKTAGKVDIYLVMDVYELKSLIYQDQKKFQPALENHILFSNLKDSLTNAENKARMTEAEGKYQNDLKQTEIDKLKQERELKDARLDRQRILQIGSISVMVFILIIAGILISWYIKVNRNNRLLEIERVRNTIARDLHDDIGSTLSSINILSQVASGNDNGTSKQYFQRIGEQSSKMMENMSDIVWSINPNNDSLEQVVIKMKEFTAEILEPLNITYRFQTEAISGDIKLNSASRKNVFLIFKEAINNAAKYSDASLVTISVSATPKTLTFAVEDNGKGFDSNTVKEGNGLKNMTFRAKDLGGKLSRITTPGSGTKIVLELSIA